MSLRRDPGPLGRWLFRRLLVLYPPEFRAAYGREIYLVFIDRCRERPSRRGLLAVWLQAATGLVLTAPGEHIHMIVQDLRFALRMLRRTPLVTAVTVIVLALGIGASTVMFSIANGLLVRPLPYPHPDRLVAIDETTAEESSMGVAFPNYQDLRARNRSLAEMAVYGSGAALLAGRDGTVSVPSAQASAGILAVLGVAPERGRFYRAEEDMPNAPRVVVLGDRLWHERYGGDPAWIGKSIDVDGHPTTIVGVMPAGFHFPDRADLWLPLRISAATAPRTDHWLDGIGRLKPGIVLGQVDGELKAIMRQISRENPRTDQGQTINVLPLRFEVARSYRTAVLLLLGAVLCVLLIACANITNLLLVRAADRAREIAVRSALGASQGRLARQLLVESVLLGGLGAVAGLGLAFLGIPCLLALIPIDLPAWMHFEVDLRVLLFTVGAAVGTSLLISLAPVHLCGRLRLTETLKEGGRGGTAGRRGERIRRALVVAEVALSLTLLIGAGLMARSFLALNAAPVGFAADHVLTVRISRPLGAFDVPRSRALIERMGEEARSLPGVTASAVASFAPLEDTWGRSLTVEDAPLLRLREAPMINHTLVTPGYFQALRIPLLAGRDFTPADGKGQRLTIIDQALARRYWPHGSAIGKQVRFGPPEDNEPWHTVVGVVGEVRNQRMNEVLRQSVYLPLAEIPQRNVTLIVRAGGAPAAIADALRRRLGALDRSMAVSEVRELARVVSETIWQQRFFAVLFVAFAALALLLAAVGLYGVMSYAVSRRRRELGLRVALGASASSLRRLVLGEAGRLAALGLLVGGGAALALSRVLGGELYGVRPTDPLTFGVMALLLVTVTMLASFLPASRAVRSDPIDALRED